MSLAMRACGSRVSAFKGNQVARSHSAPLGSRGVAAATMMKKDIHPEYYNESKVMCNGVEVMVTSGTKAVYNVDIYSGNHPFYQGNKAQVVVDEGELNKFKRRFSELDDLCTVAPAGNKADLTAFKAEKAAKNSKKKK